MRKVVNSGYGEIPKRLKGLPWKGSRSLIAARGFKSLFLRFKTFTKVKMRFDLKKDFEKNKKSC